jgi:hypothetical protein
VSTIDSTSPSTGVLRWTAPDENAEQTEFSAPLGAVSTGSLRIESGATNITIVTGESSDLIRALFKRPYPTVEVWNGTVTINYRHDRIKDWLSVRHQPEADLVLNQSIPWDVSVHGGVSKLKGDLSRAAVRSFDIGGGVSGIRVTT